MHNSYFVLRALGYALNEKLIESNLVSCFTQEKNELILIFTKEEEEHYLHVVLRSDFSVIRVPESMSRARKNSVDLFTEIYDKTVQAIYCVENERCVCIEFGGNCTLLFKMYGNQSNVILYEAGVATKIFKNNLFRDLQIDLETISKNLSIDREKLESLDWDFTKLHPALGGKIKAILKEKGYHEESNEVKWRMILELMQYLQTPEYYIIEKEGHPELSLFEPIHEPAKFKTKEVIEALNYFYIQYTRAINLAQLRRKLASAAEKKKKRAEATIKKSVNRLNQLESGISYRLMADLIMANLHNIKPGDTKAVLPNFEGDQTIEIKLKESLSPQKNAEQYYRKSKSQNKEIEILQEQLKTSKEVVKASNDQLAFIKTCDDLKELKKQVSNQEKGMAGFKNKPASVFKEFNHQEYQILVGRNASNNDLLTQKHARKDDLWLHARDVKGSHVIIKKIPGQQFSTTVIERAASLAAYYSKRRNESLCPVIYTEKKFVRKPKGTAPGQVLVEREKVIMVKPEP